MSRVGDMLIPCGRVHPDHGSRVVCELPEGHDGHHRGQDPAVAKGDERYWLWTDDREADSR